MPNSSEERRQALRLLPYMGVIAVVAEAEKLGFVNGDPAWINLGQGQPEVGELDGAPPRFDHLDFEPIDHAYGPVHGTPELRQAVADTYNRLFRHEHASKYTADNVAISSGGRLALSRAVVTLAPVRVGFQVPDYSAYEDMLGCQLPRIEPVPLFAREQDGFALPGARLDREIDEQALDAFLVSNPCNPTGVVVQGEDLAGWVRSSRERSCTLLSDEFYSHFIYTADGAPAPGPISAAAHVGDVDRDPVLVFDGLTKNFRYPGWRIGWVVGPRDLIECFITAGSSIDGGPSRPMQRAALAVLESSRADQETTAVREQFARKRNLMLGCLKELGVRFAHESEGTFYVWGCLEDLKPPFNDAETFFHEALKRKVLTVPGYYFDVNPGRLRDTGTFDRWMRFSFGPPYPAVEEGLGRLVEMVNG